MPPAFVHFHNFRSFQLVDLNSSAEIATVQRFWLPNNSKTPQRLVGDSKTAIDAIAATELWSAANSAGRVQRRAPFVLIFCFHSRMPLRSAEPARIVNGLPVLWWLLQIHTANRQPNPQSHPQSHPQPVTAKRKTQNNQKHRPVYRVFSCAKLINKFNL